MGTGDLLAVPLAALGVGLLLAPDLALATPTACVPGLGVLLGLRDALAGTLDPALLVLALAVTTAAAALLVRLAGRLLGREANIRRVWPEPTP